jgi:hypothetical protein
MAGTFGICEPGHPVIPELEKLHASMDSREVRIIARPDERLADDVSLNGCDVHVTFHSHVILTCIYAKAI